MEGEEEGLEDGVTIAKSRKTKRIQRFIRPCIARVPKSKGNGTRIIVTPSDRYEPFWALVLESGICYMMINGVLSCIVICCFMRSNDQVRTDVVLFRTVGISKKAGCGKSLLHLYCSKGRAR